MRTTRFRTPAGAAACLVVAAALLGCSQERTVEPVAPDALEVKIADALEEEFGVRPVISCSEELPAEAGAETTCELTTEDDPDTVFPVTATVTAVDSDSGEVEFDVEVAEVPQDSEAPQEQNSPTEEQDSPEEEQDSPTEESTD